MKKFVVTLLMGVVAANFAMAADMKIGVVDLQKALQSVEEGKKARTTLEKEFNEKKKSIQAEEDALKKVTEDFKKKSMVMSADAKAQKEGEIQERIMKYREMFSKAQVDIQTRERELTEPIINKLRTIVQDIGEKDSYSVILERNENAVLYHMKKDDLTDRVVSAYNK